MFLYDGKLFETQELSTIITADRMVELLLIGV